MKTSQTKVIALLLLSLALAQRLSAQNPVSSPPRFGTFYSMQFTNWPPLPELPFDLPVYEAGASGIFWYDDTQVDYQALAQARAAARAQRQSQLTTGAPPPPPPGGDDDGEDPGVPPPPPRDYPPGSLWLEVLGCSNLVALAAHGAQGGSWYMIESSHDLTSWMPEGAFIGAASDWTPADVGVGGRAKLFLRARLCPECSATALALDWQLHFFGVTGLDPQADPDADGYNLLAEQQAGLDPNKIAFAIAFATDRFDSNQVPGGISLYRGSPAFMALLVDNTDTASASWTNYAANFTVDLGATDGWHEVRVGLRGFPSSAIQTWHTRRVKLDRKPPLLVVTRPVSRITSRPILQLAGHSLEPLRSLRYDLSNATEVVRNQIGFITGQTYDTSTAEFTTNLFQCFDLPLALGTNAIALRATDLAGNLTVTNLTVTLSFPDDAPPPLIAIHWPQDGATIGAASFTCRGQLDDPTATIAAQIIDAAGNATNTVTASVERDGLFWVDGLPLANGTNILTLNVTNAAGKSSATNLIAVKTDVAIMISTLPVDLLYRGKIPVTATINTSGYTLWMNGKRATDNGGNTWTWDEVPLSPSGTPIVQVRAIPNTDHGGNGTGGGASPGNGTGGGASPGNEDLANPASPQAVTQEARTEKTPRGPYVDSYSAHETGKVVGNDLDNLTSPISTDIRLGWSDGLGGAEIAVNAYGARVNNDVCTWVGAWAASAWPDLPYGTYDQTCHHMDETRATIDPPPLPWVHIDACNEQDFPPGNTNGGNVWTRQAQATLKLDTGGKPGRQALYRITASACAILYEKWQPWREYDPPTIDVPPEMIEIGGLGRLGSDGNLYVVLPDLISVDLAPRVEAYPNYQFWAAAPGYRLQITAQGNICLDSMTLQTNAHFIVGEKLTLAGTWSEAPPGLKTKDCKWTLPGTYVNKSEQPYPAGSVNWTSDASLLTNETTYGWWVSGEKNPPGATYTASLVENLGFSNGQYAVMSEQGRLAMLRPLPIFNASVREEVRVDSEWYWSNNRQQKHEGVNLHFGIASSITNEGIAFKYNDAPLNPKTGETYGIYALAQVIENWRQQYNLQDGTTCTGYQAEGWLGLDGEFPTLGPASSAPQSPPDSWADSPGTPLSIARWLRHATSFSTFLMFKPSIDESIYVPMYSVSWSWSGTATNYPWGKASGSSTAGQPNPTEQFPSWTNVISGFNTMPENCTVHDCFQ
jgi:hypothetical protein